MVSIITLFIFEFKKIDKLSSFCVRLCVIHLGMHICEFIFASVGIITRFLAECRSKQQICPDSSALDVRVVGLGAQSPFPCFIIDSNLFVCLR